MYTDPSRSDLARYRLRFLLQEIDVHRGVTLIGRSPDCQVTIEDPLVSRQHARITIDDAGPRLEDLKSRNGVKVNNQPVKGSVPIKDGDRLRIGTQELVFCELADQAVSPGKTTGFLRHCARCRLPYPQELLACPNCGETMQLEEDTMTGQLGGEASRQWGVQLLLEVLDKALALGRLPDAVRSLQRMQAQLEERITAGERPEPRQLEEIARSSCALATATRDAAHVTWLLRLYPRANLVPTLSVIETIAPVALALRADMRTDVDGLLEWARASNAADLQRRLEQLVGAMMAADARGDPDQTTRNPVLS